LQNKATFALMKFSEGHQGQVIGGGCWLLLT